MARCDSYDAGECTKGACIAEGWIRDHWGNADEWLARAARDGFDTSDVPTVNAVAVFRDSHLYDGQFGHCAIVEDVVNYNRFKVLEMNFANWGQYDNRWCNRTGLLGFILAPGTAPGWGTGPEIDLSSPAKTDLEYVWSRMTDFWNYDIDAEVVGLVNITSAIQGIS